LDRTPLKKKNDPLEKKKSGKSAEPLKLSGHFKDFVVIFA
jgi:hypothetical protein